MAISISEISLTDAPLPPPGFLQADGAGAVVDFWGIVRALEDGAVLLGINYEVHRAMAEHQMKALVERAIRDFSLTALCLRHRVGFVPVAEASLFLRVASSHRPAVFGAAQWLIDELKQKVPIWKRPVYQDRPIHKTQVEPNELKKTARLA